MLKFDKQKKSMASGFSTRRRRRRRSLLFWKREGGGEFIHTPAVQQRETGLDSIALQSKGQSFTKSWDVYQCGRVSPSLLTQPIHCLVHTSLKCCTHSSHFNLYIHLRRVCPRVFVQLPWRQFNISQDIVCNEEKFLLDYRHRFVTKQNHQFVFKRACVCDLFFIFLNTTTRSCVKRQQRKTP